MFLTNIRPNLKSTYIKAFLMCAFLVGLFFVSGNVVMAQQPPDLGLQFAAQSGLGTTDIRVTVARIIRAFLGLLGVIAVGLILYGGYVWMTAGGDDSKVSQAKKIITNAAIGLAILLSAFSITQFVINSLADATLGTGSLNGSGGGGAQQFGGGGFGGGALGRSLQAHYPDRGATNIARNTKIIITFNEEIKSDTIFDGQGKLNVDSIKLYKTIDANNGSFPANSKLITDVQAQTADNKTFVLRPQTFLGSPSENIAYSVFLTNNIKKTNGDGVFSGIAPSYAWEFTTGTSIDTTPPRVDSVTPLNAAGCPGDATKCNPRNRIIQINFSEPVDPTTISGNVPGFNLIDLQYQNSTSGGKKPVPGEFIVSNHYQTVTFMPTGGCDGVKENSCGQEVFCLPGNAAFDVNIKAAAIDTQLGAPQAAFPYNGVVDVAGNSLDGQGGPTNTADGKAEGPTKDSYKWTFNTNNTVDLVPPHIISVVPDVNQSSVALAQDIEITFSKDILGSSLFGGINVEYNSTQEATRKDWLGPSSIEFGKKQKTIIDPTTKKQVQVSVVDTKNVVWKHYDQFTGSTQKTGTFIYYPQLLSSMTDDSQNCFFPAEGPTKQTPSQKCERLDSQTIYPNNWKNNTNNKAQYPNCTLN